MYECWNCFHRTNHPEWGSGWTKAWGLAFFNLPICPCCGAYMWPE